MSQSQPASPLPISGGSMIALLIAVSALNPLSVNIIVPALTSMAEGLHTDFATIQLTLSAYLFATAISQLVHGPLSDRFGRRPVLLGGIIIYILASLICLSATSAWVVITGRILQGIGAAAGFALGRAIVRDLFEREKAASMLGYVTMGFATAPMVAPLIGGLISDHLGWRLVFLFLTVMSLLLLLVVWLALPETRQPTREGEIRAGFLESFAILSRIPAFWAYALNVGFTAAVFFTFLGGTPFVATTLFGMSGTEYGIYFALVPVGYMIGNFITARFARRAGIGRLIVAGGCLGTIAALSSAVLLLSGWESPPALFAPMYVMGISNGLTMSNGIVGAVSVRPALAGAASGITGSFQVGFGAIATVIIGYVLTATHAAWPVGVCMTILALAALAFGLWTWVARSD